MHGGPKFQGLESATAGDAGPLFENGTRTLALNSQRGEYHQRKGDRQKQTGDNQIANPPHAARSASLLDDSFELQSPGASHSRDPNRSIQPEL